MATRRKPAQISTAGLAVWKLALLWLFRFVVGGLFLFSGAIKVNDVLGFSYKLVEYFQVFESDTGIAFTALNGAAVGMAAFITVIEMALGFTLLLGALPAITTSLLLLMIIFFTFLTGYSAVTGAVSDCGCFGDAIKLTPRESFYKDLVLLFLISYLFVFRDYIGGMLPRVGNLITAGLLTLGTIGVCWYTLTYLPIVDFRAYKVGNDLKVLNNELDANDIPRLAGYSPFTNKDCQVDDFKGPVLWIVMYNIGKTSPEDVKLTELVAQLAKQQGIAVVGMTATLSDERDAIVKQQGLSYCFAAHDETMLKTIIRSNPGYVLLEDGVVKAKWSQAARPTESDLLSALGR